MAKEITKEKNGIKQHDFIEIDYTGKIKETNQVFDTTKESIAKKENIYNPKSKYKPMVICVGENQVPPGMDESFIGKKTGDYNIALQPEKAFGKKNPKLLQLVSQSSFKKQNITPYPGLQVNVDNTMGTVRTVTPGRVIVDFNHPLSGKEIQYEIEIKKKISDKKEQLDSYLSYYLPKFTTEVNEKNEVIINADIPEQVKEMLKNKITTLIPSIKKITIKKE